jgi:hypothetical protein
VVSRDPELSDICLAWWLEEGLICHRAQQFNSRALHLLCKVSGPSFDTTPIVLLSGKMVEVIERMILQNEVGCKNHSIA